MSTTVSTPRKVAAAVTSSATLAKGRHTPVDATTSALTLTLPADAAAGVELSVEKIDAGTNAVTVSGTLRGSASTIALTAQYEARTFLSEGSGSWRPLSDHRTKASLDAAYVALLPAANGTDDTTAIQTALTAARVAGGGRVRSIPRQTYRISAPLVIGSNTELDMTGSTVQSISGRDHHLLHNYAYTAPAGVAADGAMTSGSNVVTTALGATATVGQNVTVNGASNGGWQAICGRISARTATTITIVDDYGTPVNAGTTVSAATVQVFTPDTNIRVVGGLWNKNGVATQGATIGSHIILMRHVDGLRLSGQRITGNCGKYAFSLAAVSDYVVEGTVGVAAFSDGVHIDGPATRGMVRDIYGSYGDDMVAVTPMDWRQFGDVCGDVTDLVVENIVPSSTIRAVVKVLGGLQGAAKNITIRDIGGSTITDAGAIWVGDDIGQPETAGGFIDNIRIEKVNIKLLTAGSRQLYLNGVNIGRVLIDGWTLDSTTHTLNFFELDTPTAGVVESLTVSNIYIRNFNASANLAVLRIGGNSTVRKLTCRDWHSSATQGFAGVNIAAGTVADLVFDGFQGNWRPWTNGLGALVYMQQGSNGILQRATFNNCHVLGNNNGGVFVTASTSTQTVPQVAISNSVAVSCAWVVALNTATNLLLTNVVVTTPGQGLAYAYDLGFITVNGSGNNLAAGGANWNSAGGKIAIRAIDAPPSTHTGCIPTITAGGSAGAAPTVALSGSDRTGNITVTPGTGPTAGGQATVTFIGTWPQVPKVSLMPTNAAAQAAGAYVTNKSSTAFTITTVNAPSGAMTFDYTILA